MPPSADNGASFVTLRLPAELKAKLQAEADSNDRALSAEIRRALRYWVGELPTGKRPKSTRG